MTFCLVPKILNSVYMVMIFSKMCVVIEARTANLTYIKYIIAKVGIRVNNAISRIGNNVAG